MVSLNELDPITQLDSTGRPRTHYQFSPDSRFLALRIYKSLDLYNLPNLELVQSFDLSHPIPKERASAHTYVEWAIDGKSIATIDASDLVVIDLEQDVIHRLALASIPYYVRATEQGWLIKSRNPNNDTAFSICERSLESCEVIDNLPNEYYVSYASNSEGSKLILRRGVNNEWVWGMGYLVVSRP